MIYRLLRAVVRHALRVYFRDLEVEGREQVPGEGPLLLAANHPNTLIDVLLIASSLDRRVGFVAKATLFRGWLGGRLLRLLGAVPVSRQEDGPLDAASRERNQRALAACEEAVARGDAVLIFPEGVSRDAPRLGRLKTGLARIALGAEARASGRVSVVPVGLTYDRPETFRSRARVRFGAPIEVAPFAELPGGDDGFTRARALTEAVGEALKADVVHVDAEHHDPLVRELDTLYGRRVEPEVGGRLAATAAIARALNAFARSDPERVRRVRDALEEYRRALATAGVDDVAVRAREGGRPTLVEDLAFYLGAPLALWGIAHHAVYYQIPRLIVRLVAPDRLYASTVKLLSGLLALSACYAAQTWLAAALVGPTAAAVYLATLPLTGLAALVWLEGLDARRRARRARRRFAALEPARARDLTAQRAALVRELDLARAEVLASSLAGGDGAAAPVGADR